VATKIDDMAPRHVNGKPPQKPVTSEKTTSKTAEGVNQTVSIVRGCPISSFVVGG
jgi:hypothetical protein